MNKQAQHAIIMRMGKKVKSFTAKKVMLWLGSTCPHKRISELVQQRKIKKRQLGYNHPSGCRVEYRVIG